MYLYNVVDQRVFKHPVERDALILQNVLNTTKHMPLLFFLNFLHLLRETYWYLQSSTLQQASIRRCICLVSVLHLSAWTKESVQRSSGSNHYSAYSENECCIGNSVQMLQITEHYRVLCNQLPSVKQSEVAMFYLCFRLTMF